MKRAILSIIFLSLAAPVAARDPSFVQPLDCALGDDCYIPRYLDHDTSESSADYHCATQTGNGHTGTDFALPTLRAMNDGVDVLSTAPGIVVAVRDDMRDVSTLDKDAPNITGQSCGNGVLVTHGNGWETQYCHLKQGSVTVQRGQKVASGTPLGKVGLSGDTSFPHLHLTVRKDGNLVDPFAPHGNLQCGEHPDPPLWETEIFYQPGGIASSGFAPNIPTFDAIREGTAGAAILFGDQPIVLWGRGYGGQAGDIMRIIIRGQGGAVFEERITIPNALPEYFRAAGKRPPAEGWPSGRFRGTVDIVRNGKTIDRKVTYVTVVN